MTIFLILALCLLCLFAYRSHEFILFYAPFSVVLQPWMCIRYSAPALTVSFAINFVLTIYLLLFLLLKRGYLEIKNPFFYVIALMMLDNIIGLLSSGNDIFSSIPSFIQNICAYTPLVLLYDELQTEKDLRIVLKSFVYVAMTLLVYGFVEFILQTNTLFLYIITKVSETDLFGKIYFEEDSEIRFGSIRCQSLMVISIAWGALCVIFFGVIVTLKNYLKKFFNKDILYIMILLSLVGTFSAGSRSPYVFLAIILLPFFLKNFSIMEKFFCVIVVSITMFWMSSTIDGIVESFSSRSDVSGSSVEMRVDQLETIFVAMKDNSIFGIGNKGLGYILKKYPNVYGAESVWFHTFISAGICGVILLILQYYLSFRIIIKEFNRTRKLEMIFFLLGWIIFSTITTSPGLSYVYFLTMITVIMKCDAICLHKYGRINYD